MNTPWKPKPWLAVLLGLVTGSFTFLYVNQLKLFWAYLAVSLVSATIDWYFHLYISPAVYLTCTIHAFLAAKKYNPEQPRPWHTRWWALPTLYVAMVGPFVLIRVFIFALFSIPAASMSPNINVGNYIVISKHGYGDYGAYGIKAFNTGLATGVDPTPGKIYAFYPPHNPKTPFIKRLIGKPGDKIEIQGYQISINGKPIEQKFLSEDAQYTYYEERIGNVSYTVQRTKEKPLEKNVELIVPQGQYFFMGDNRDNSADSRFWGTVSDHSFIGELFFVVKT